MIRTSTSRIFISFIAAFTLAVTGCGDDSSPPTFEPNNENNENNKNNDNNMNNTLNNSEDMGPDADPDGGDDPDMVDMDSTDTDTDMTCPTVPCGSDRICVDGMCLDADACGSAFDLGQLAAGDSVERSGSFVFEGTDQLQLSCSGDDASRERVFQFELTERSFVDITADWMGQFNGAAAIRTVCDDDTSEDVCAIQPIRDVELEAGVYFLILEVAFGTPGAFELQLATRPAACTLGERQCVGNVLETCPDGQIERFSCASTCVNGECTGDTCSTPIVINDAGDTFAGDGGGYSSALNFSNSTCSMDMSSGTTTPGYDLVFSLPGLSVGDIITIDAESNDPNANAIFVRTACGDLGSCLATYTSTEDVDYVVQSPGDHWVIVDKIQQPRTMFNYSVTVQ